MTQTKGTRRFSERTIEDRSDDKDKIEVGTTKDQFLGLESQEIFRSVILQLDNKKL